jgi:hypothetical protein
MGFDVLRFFLGVTCRGPLHMEAGRVSALVGPAMASEPIDLASKELLSLYHLRPNSQGGPPFGPAQAFVLFVSGHVPFAGDARFDLNRWDYANYSPDWTGASGETS